MNVLLIDDEELALEVLERMLSRIDDIRIVGKYTDPGLVLEQIDAIEADAVFLDLEMGAIHGLQFAEELYNRQKAIEIVFVTSYSQFAIEAFDLNAVDYLLKPVSPERLQKTMDKLKQRLVIQELEKNTATAVGMNYYIHVMGTFWLSSDSFNLQIKWRTKKVKELFVYLWHYKEQPIHRTRIIEELWPDTSGDKGAALLHTTVYHLRKTLKEIGCGNSLQYANEQYTLYIDFNSDVKELKAYLYEAHPSVHQIRNMLLLYEGDYLEEEGYFWAIYEQQSIRKTFLMQLEKFLGSLQQEKPRDPFIEICLIKMLQIDSYNDEYTYLLMLHYKNMGNRRKLMEVYEDHTKKLKEELGIGLPYKMIELYRTYIKR